MLKIGIVGSESTHSQTFARLANLPGPDGTLPFDARVTMIWGCDPDRTKQVAEENKIPAIVNNPLDMIGKVDAVMIDPRKGSQHYKYTMPFLKAGVPAWVDKPFTVDYGEALELVRAAKAHGVLLCGGSTCKYSYDVAMLKARFELLHNAKDLVSAAFNFSGDIHSEYDGIYFYGSHSAEMLATMFGTDVRSLKTDVHCGNLVALAKYSDFTVTMNFSKGQQSYGTLYSPSGVVMRPIDITFSAYTTFEKFVAMLENKCPPEDPKILLSSVRILNALQESIDADGAEIPVKPIGEI